MSVVNKRPGAPIQISLGRRDEAADVYNARLAGIPQMVTDPVTRRTSEQCTVIYHAVNLDGEDYLAERVHNLAFAIDRDVRDELLDGSLSEPKTWQQLVIEKGKAAFAFAASRTGQSADASALLASPAESTDSAEMPI